jgi:hypothetical protein
MPLEHEIVQKELARFFGRPIEVESRALISLAVVSNVGFKGGRKPPRSIHVWSALRLNLPAVQHLYDALNVDPEARPQPHVNDVLPYDPWTGRFPSGKWQQVFRHLFTERGSLPEYDVLTRPAREMRESGRVTALGLAKSILASGINLTSPAVVESGSGGIRYWERPRPNMILRGLARCSGRGRHQNWNPQLRQFGEQAQAVLDGLAQLDAGLGQQQFLLYHDGARYRITPFGAIDQFRLLDQSGGTSWLSRANAVQEPVVQSPFSAAAISDLEELINSSAPESAFQEFFEAAPEFLVALGPYANVHPQLVLRREDGTRLIPDFFLERLDTDFCDVLDLKRSTAELVRRQMNRDRFRATVMDGLAQLEEYRDYFERPTHREAFRSAYSLDAYRPRVVIIIGRQRSFYDEVERIRLESGLPGWVRLKTYDDVLSGAQRWRSWVAGGL